MASKKPKKPKPPAAAAPATAPAEGERRALRGYIGQYERASAAIYAALEREELLWIGVADRNAGIADDLVLGFDGLVVGHQFKTSKFPGTFTVETLFTGANGLWKPLVRAWQCLRKDRQRRQKVTVAMSRRSSASSLSIPRSRLNIAISQSQQPGGFMPQAREGDPSAYVVVLVHGTWAPGAAWTRSGSVLRRELEVHLIAGGASTVRFVDDFRWSGANSHEARRSAAACLNRRLHGVLRDFPGAHTFVVAHSHGGNLALRAIGLSKRLRDGISGVICISTPFLLFAPRRAILATLVGAYEETIGYLGELVGRYFLHGLIAAAVGVMATPFYVLWVKFGPSALTQSQACLPLGQPACSPVVAWSIGAVLAVVVWAYSAALWKEGWNRAKRSLGPLFVHEGNRILRRYGYVQPRQMVAGLHVLSLSSVFDEALTALTGAWWVHMTSGALIRTAMTLSAAAAVMLMGAVVFFVFAGLESLRSHPWAFPIAEKVAVIPILLSGIGLLLLLRWTARTLVPIAARSSFGASLPDPAKNLILSVHARREVTAMTAWESKRFGLLMLLYTSKGMLFHSLIYNCPPALAHVGSWMLRMAAMRRAPAAAS